MKHRALIKNQFSLSFSLLALMLSSAAFADKYFAASCTDSNDHTVNYFCVGAGSKNDHDRWCAYGNQDCMSSVSTKDCDELYDSTAPEYANCMEAFGEYDSETGTYGDNDLKQEFCGKEDYVYGDGNSDKAFDSNGKAIKLDSAACNYNGGKCIYVAGSDDGQYKSSCHIDYIGLLSLESDGSKKLFNCGGCHYQFNSTDEPIGVNLKHVHVKTEGTRYAAMNNSSYSIPLSFNVTARSADNTGESNIEHIWSCPTNDCDKNSDKWETVWNGREAEVKGVSFTLSPDTQVTQDNIEASGASGSTGDYMFAEFKVHSVNAGESYNYYDNIGYVKFLNVGTASSPEWWAYAIGMDE